MNIAIASDINCPANNFALKLVPATCTYILAKLIWFGSHSADTFRDQISSACELERSGSPGVSTLIHLRSNVPQIHPD